MHFTYPIEVKLKLRQDHLGAILVIFGRSSFVFCSDTHRQGRFAGAEQPERCQLPSSDFGTQFFLERKHNSIISNFPSNATRHLPQWSKDFEKNNPRSAFSELLNLFSQLHVARASMIETRAHLQVGLPFVDLCRSTQRTKLPVVLACACNPPERLDPLDLLPWHEELPTSSHGQGRKEEKREKNCCLVSSHSASGRQIGSSCGRRNGHSVVHNQLACMPLSLDFRKRLDNGKIQFDILHLRFHSSSLHRMGKFSSNRIGRGVRRQEPRRMRLQNAGCKSNFRAWTLAKPQLELWT